jgi:hypothetical protein
MDITYQLATNITLNHVIEKIEHITFPPIRKKMMTMILHEPFTGVWAVRENNILGAILADKNPMGESEIFSFFVVPAERHKGMGSKLLSLLETSLKNQGIKQIQSRYRNDWGSLAVIEKILQSDGWKVPQLLRIIAEIDINQYTRVPWPSIKIPGDFTLFKWNELTRDDRLHIDEMLRNRAIPPEFNPYQHEDQIFLPASIGMRNKGIIIGWNIVYSLSDDTKEYNNLFLKAEFRKLGHAITLLHRSFGEQHKISVPKATWMINADNAPALKIAQRIAGEYVSKFIEVKISKKVL